MPNTSVRPHGATPTQWARHWEGLRDQTLTLVAAAFNDVAADLAAGDRRAAAMMARFEVDQTQAVDGIADALFTLLTTHIRRTFAATIPSIPSRSQATRQQARTVRGDR